MQNHSIQIFLLLIFIIYSISCSTTKEFPVKNKLCDINETSLKDQKKLNLEYYSSIPFKKDSANFTFEIVKSSNGYFYHKTNNETKTEKSVSYDSLGRVEWSKFIYVNGAIEIDIETKYDKNGAIVEIINHEKGYEICWAEAIAIIKKKLAKKLGKYSAVSYVLQRANINEFPDSRPLWSVGVVPVPNDRIGETTYYKIDGVTGKYLGKFKAKMVP